MKHFYFKSIILSLLMMVIGVGNGFAEDRFEKYSGEITEGDYLLVSGETAMNTTVSSNRLQFQAVKIENGIITQMNNGSKDFSTVVWTISKSGDYYTLYNATEGKYAASTGTKNQAQLLESGTDDKSLWTITGTSTYEFVNKKNASNGVNKNLRKNPGYGFACYSTSTGESLTLYKKVVDEDSPLSFIAVTGVTPTPTFYVGDAFVFGGTVTATYENGNTNNVTNLASFSGYDMSTAGDQTVTVSYTEGEITKTKTYQITVKNRTLQGIEVEAPTTSFNVGDDFSFGGAVTAIYYDESTKDIPEENVTFSGYDMSTAGDQTVTVSYTEGGVTKTTTYNITVNAVAATFVTVDPSEVTIVKGSTSQLTATVGPDNATDKTVNWSSDNPSVATVSSDGVVTAVAAGDAVITAKANGGVDDVKSECAVTVVNELVYDTYTMVEDVANLAAGDKVIIVNTVAQKAMSTTQYSNNRGATDVTIEDNKAKVPSTTDIQVFTLEGDANGWYFNTVNGEASGYIYVASSSNNYLKTETEADDNAKASISISDGNATIKFQGSYTRNLLKYNSGSDLFSCYASGQQPVQLYKKVTTTTNQYTLVAGTEEYPFEGLTLTKALPEHTQFCVKDGNGNVFHSTDTQTQLIINAENHENLPTSAEGNDFYLSKANTWVFTLTEGEGGAVTLTVNPETPGATQYMLSETYLTASDAIFDASYKLTKEMTTDEFFIVRSDDYGLTNLTPANFNAPEDRRYWIFSEDAPTVEFITGEIRGSYTVAEAGLYNITLDLTNNTVTAEKAPDVRTAMFCNEFFGYEAGTAAQKDESKFEGDADGVTIVVNKGTSTTKMFVSDSELRVYKGNSMSFTAPNGYNLTKIVFTPTTISDWKGSVTPDVETMTEKTWTGKSETVEFSIGASNRLTKAEITLAPGKQSAALKYAVDEYRTETESGEVTDAPKLTKAEGYDGTISYTSSDEEIAIVDAQTGTVTAVAVGDVTITATGTETDTYNGGKASYVLHVGYLDAQMKFAKDAVTVPIGGSVENTLTKKTSAEVVYVSDNEAVASVDAGGNVTVKAVGSATITATAEKADPYKAGEVSYTITVEDKTGSEYGSKSCFYEPFDYDGGTGGNDGQFKGNVASSNFVTNYSGTNNWAEISYLGLNCARAGTGSLKGTATVSGIAVEAGKTYHLNFKAAPFNEERTVMDVTVEGGTIDGLSTEAMANSKWNDLSATIKATADELTLTFTADQNRFFLDEIRLADPTDLNTASVTIPASGWASYCCEYPIEFTDNGDVKAYAVTKVSGNKATLTQVTGTIKGGVPLFINGAAGEHPLTVAEHSTNEVDGNLLKGTLSPTYVAGETSEAINYGLKSGELHAIVSGTMPAGKAYLPIAKNVAPAGSKLSLVFEDATGINQYQNIQADGIFYDLQGRRVGNPQKGIYVRNGKKVVIK